MYQYTHNGYSWIYYNSLKGEVISSGSGTYQLEGNSYEEQGKFIHQPQADFRSVALRRCDTTPEQLEGMHLAQKQWQLSISEDRMYCSGNLANGTFMEETWQRVK